MSVASSEARLELIDAATIAAILDVVSNGIALSFTLTGLAIDREKLEVVEFCYDYEL